MCECVRSSVHACIRAGVFVRSCVVCLALNGYHGKIVYCDTLTQSERMSERERMRERMSDRDTYRKRDD